MAEKPIGNWSMESNEVIEAQYTWIDLSIRHLSFHAIDQDVIFLSMMMICGSSFFFSSFFLSPQYQDIILALCESTLEESLCMNYRNRNSQKCI